MRNRHVIQHTTHKTDEEQRRDWSRLTCLLDQVTLSGKLREVRKRTRLIFGGSTFQEKKKSKDLEWGRTVLWSGHQKTVWVAVIYTVLKLTELLALKAPSSNPIPERGVCVTQCPLGPLPGMGWRGEKRRARQHKNEDTTS